MTVPGVDVDALTAWWDATALAPRHGPLGVTVIAGGRSNLTYRVDDATTSWALRRPPLGHVLPTAHDMAREYRVISALAPTDVPVPQAVALCTDTGVLGAPFYLMSYVEGVVLDSDEHLAALDTAAAARAGELLADTLVALHAVDPAAVGLGDFGRPDGFLRRQVDRWHRQWQASETRPVPQLAGLVERLAASVPEPHGAGIVHGDYRLTNCMYDRGVTRIAAVVDWEMAALGDPLADVGLLVVYHDLAAQDDGVMRHMDASAGFLTSGQLVERYAAGSGRDVSQLRWYVAFGYFKLAVISEGIAARFAQGLTVGEGFERYGDQVPGLVDRALAELGS